MVISKNTMDMPLIHIPDTFFFRQGKVVIEGIHGRSPLTALPLMSPLVVVLVEP
jgi:hypothetical protein